MKFVKTVSLLAFVIVACSDHKQRRFEYSTDGTTEVLRLKLEDGRRLTFRVAQERNGRHVRVTEGKELIQETWFHSDSTSMTGGADVSFRHYSKTSETEPTVVSEWMLNEHALYREVSILNSNVWTTRQLAFGTNVVKIATNVIRVSFGR